MTLVGALVLNRSKEGRHAAFAQRRPESRVEGLVSWAGHDTRCDAADLFGNAALRLALREWWKRRERGTGGAGGDRRLGFLIATAQAHIGEALQQ